MVSIHVACDMDGSDSGADQSEKEPCLPQPDVIQVPQLNHTDTLMSKRDRTEIIPVDGETNSLIKQPEPRIPLVVTIDQDSDSLSDYCAEYADGEGADVDEVFIENFSQTIELGKVNSRKSKGSYGRSNGDRKPSFAQELRRRFTIKDSHKSEVTKRFIALVIKYALFVFNFISWVVATAVVGGGLYVLSDKGKLVVDGTGFFLDPTVLSCITGGITFVVAFLGCVGALRENLVLLKVFFVILTAILFVEVILGVAVFVISTVPAARENVLWITPEKVLKEGILRYMDDPAVKAWMDMVQQEFKCCGISHTDEGFRDWQMNLYYNCTPSNRSIYRCAVPTSCCIFEAGDRINIMCGFAFTNESVVVVRDYIYTRGCIHGFSEWLSKYDDIIIISSLSIIIMQILAVVSAKLMVVRIQKQRQRWTLLRQTCSTSFS